ncbi:fumarylacetoacetate hydrolase family protein [Alicyclobacillus fastidiosus]|uniref:Fumarylacetoacetate hydrolase family protein n=1 Tax=Alicyclobacillus fastidiosus TaxID=392011 RepID=A0ABY6ZNI3_9BACL|nr:fumarylacetoacetate hydrolase family protein [Alicyclobacillus fastidiosus]WAH44395.1 fumarylacetoacetate hydrolase family protein [Alicyclobacillus fastidiosus]GMA60733.1 2-hydroxyhepta-2,4-diene-1,7-dioate isomerase [Alicyclobacillus fastidiosus]
MKILTFYLNEQEKIGIKLENNTIIDFTQLDKVSDSTKLSSVTVDDLIRDPELISHVNELIEKYASELGEYAIPEEDITFGPCVPRPGKIICIGLNYRRHAIETNAPIPTIPIVFSKFSDTVASHLEEIPLPKKSNEVDYEAELGVVIGRRSVDVPRDYALDYVFGYCNVNDLSARDLQMCTHQWLLGKTCEKFAPIGPYLVTADEVGDPNKLGIRAFVNGEKRQDSNTSDMIFHVDEIIEYLSQYMVLEPGDIILTGTPEGVILGFPEEQRNWLKAGDSVTIEIEKLGALTNTFRD